jgi:GT2 family glycosyltransferase
MPLTNDFSLIITAHRGGPMLQACLDSAARLDPPPRELILAIDGADPAVLDAAKSTGCKVLTHPDRPGVSATRNAAARAAAGGILVFADSDVLLRGDHLACLAKAFADHPGADAVIGSYDDEPEARSVISRYRNLLHHYTHQHGSPEAQTFWAGCGAIRRQAFEEVGGFDASYRIPSVEDIELGYRLRQAGHGIRLVPSWQVKHLKQWTFRDLIFNDIGRRAIPWTRLLIRERRFDNDLNIDHRARLSALLVCTGLAASLGGLFWRPALIIGALSFAAATAVNWSFYRFLARRGGWFLAAASIPLHWLYFAGALAGYVIGRIFPRSV